MFSSVPLCLRVKPWYLVGDMSDAVHQELYDSLWRRGEEAFARGAVNPDPQLERKEEDVRRGLTVILRLDGEVARAMADFIAELKAIEPHQYYYAPTEFHVTVLSLLTCSADYRHSPEQITAYARALARGLAAAEPFAIRFEGVTATPEAVMVQGFPDRDGLNKIRNSVRAELEADRLPIRQRYNLRGAHSTIMRFARQAKDSTRLLAILQGSRSKPFGATRVKAFELVENDWYMSNDRTRVLEQLGLTQGREGEIG